MAAKGRCVRTDPIDEAAEPVARPERLAGWFGGVDCREVSGLERLWGRRRIAIYQGRTPHQRDDLLGNPVHRNVLYDVLRLCECRRDDMDEARVEELGGIGGCTRGFLAVSSRHRKPATGMGGALF